MCEGKAKVLLGSILTFAALLFFAQMASSQGMTSVKVGILGLLDEVPLFIGMEKGYHKEIGIEIKLHKFAGGAEAMAPLAVGQLDMTVGSGIVPGLFNGIARGMSMIGVASTAQLIPGHDADILLVRPDLKNQIKTFADLKGRKVAINTPGSALVYSLGKGLETAGLTLKDVNVSYIPFPNMGVALKNKAIDVAFQVEPLVALHTASGLGVKWKGVSDFLKDPYQDIAGIFYNLDWSKKNPTVARNFMIAWLRGAREYFAADHKGPNRAKVIKIATKYTRIKKASLYDKMEWMNITPNGFFNRESVKDQLEWFHRNGLVPIKPPLHKIIDDSYVKYALEKLGRVKEIHNH